MLLWTSLALAQSPVDVGPKQAIPPEYCDPNVASSELNEDGEPMLGLGPERDCVEPPLSVPDIALPTGLVGPEGRRVSPYTSVDQLPDAVRIKTFYQGYNNFNYFALVDGKLYGKERVFAEPGQLEVVTEGGWTLFEGGLPHREKSDGKTTNLRGWDDTDYLIRMTADDDEVVVIGENNRVYWKRVVETPRFDNHWYDEWGFPIRGEFVMPPHGLDALAWGLGRRRIGSTGYFTDPAGDPHVSGFGITTMYLLSTDQHTIWFADTGLPPRLSHRMCGPERSTVKAVNLSASASTIMLIDHAGQVWTRLADYDTTGSTPGHRYNYDEEPPDGLDPFDVRTIDTNMQLPPEDWAKQPLVFPQGRPAWAHLSQEISIHQNGLGNDTRELRIVGTNDDGDLGYYRKQLLEESWEFIPAPISLADIAWLDDEAVDNPVTQYGESWDVDLEGVMRVGGAEYPIHIEDWNPVCTPAQATVSLPGGGELSFGLHSVDAWTPWRELNPAFDATTEASLGTIWLDEDTLASTDPEVMALVEELRPLHREAFSLWIDATTQGIRLDTKGVLERVEIVAMEEGFTSFEASQAAFVAHLDPSSYLEMSADPSLIVDPASASQGQLEDAIAANQELLEDIRSGDPEQIKGLSEFRSSFRQSRRLTNTMFVVNGVLRVTGIRLVGRIGDWRRPKAKRSTKFGVWTSKVSMVLENTTGMIVRSKKKDRLERKKAKAEYKEAKAILKERIERYEEALDAME